MTTPSAPDTWGPRALPVLISIVTRFDQQGAVGTEGVAEDTGLDLQTVYLACQALRDDGLIAFPDQGAEWDVWITNVSGGARRVTGAWPTPDTLVDRLLSALEERITHATSDSERTRLQKARDGLLDAGRDILVSAAAAALGGAVS
jgi:DNA-binding IclR family transcriptional regulator